MKRTFCDRAAIGKDDIVKSAAAIHYIESRLKDAGSVPPECELTALDVIEIVAKAFTHRTDIGIKELSREAIIPRLIDLVKKDRDAYNE